MDIPRLPRSSVQPVEVQLATRVARVYLVQLDINDGITGVAPIIPGIYLRMACKYKKNFVIFLKMTDTHKAIDQNRSTGFSAITGQKNT